MMGNQASAKPDPMSKLLDLMANPEKAKAQLSELTTAIEYHKKIIRESDEKKEQAREAMDALDKRAAAMSHDLAVRENAVVDREDKVSQREREVAALKRNYEGTLEQLEQRKHQLEADFAMKASELKDNVQRQKDEQEAEAEKLKKELDSGWSCIERTRAELEAKVAYLEKGNTAASERENILIRHEAKLEHTLLALQKAVDAAMAVK